MTILSPSLLSADFADLKKEIEIIDKAGAKYLHLDVMDGMFVPNITFGIPVIKSIRKCTDMVFDVHLMIEEPVRYIEKFAEAGADIIGVHVEACKHLDRTIQVIKNCGKKACVTLDPATSLDTIKHVLPKIDMVLLMSVNPGFGGQHFIPYVLEKVKELKAMINAQGIKVDIEIDGGVTLDNASELINAGADVLVAGSAVFNGDVKKNTEKFISLFADMDK